MRKYLAEHSATFFDPDTVDLLSRALDDAWAQVRAKGATFNDPAAARNTLAKLIVDAAKQGERDQRRLVASAVMHFNQ